MANLKWHANELNKIRSDMKRPGNPSGPADAGSGDDKPQSDMAKRSRPNPLLRKLRNAHRHREAQIAHPQDNSDNVIPGAWAPIDSQPEVTPATPPRGIMFALVPLSIVGMASLFVLGFVGSREIVTFLVGPDYVPASVHLSGTGDSSASAISQWRPCGIGTEPGRAT